MITKCGIYSVKRDGAFNAPFVALDDKQALSIVEEALKGFEGDFDVPMSVYRIGRLDFFDGITDTEMVCVWAAGDVIEEVENNEISKTV